MRMRILVAGIAAALSLPAVAATPTPKLLAGVVVPPFFEKQGITVLSYEKGPSGLNVWRVERNGARTVFYTTADNKTLISGIMWDAKSGENLSDRFITADVQSAQPQPTVDASQFSPGKVPDAIKGIDNLAGVKEGKAGMDKTLYIMFDPRCPHCHMTYKKTRQFVASGGTIKWIPVGVLGNPSEAAAMTAGILQASNPAQALAAAMAGNNPRATPDARTQKALAESEAYFWAAFDRNKAAGTPGVPVAFFTTKQGVPQMVGGVDDDILLQQILTEMRK